MELDDFKQAWLAHGAALEKSLAINERLLRETLLGKTRRALTPFVIARALEGALGVLVSVLVLRVLVAHLGEPRYLVVAGPLAVFAVALTGSCGYLLVRGAAIDYGGSVTQLQRDIAHLSLVEFHATKWAILGGTLLWLPVVLVVFEAITGVDALARVKLAYLVANLVFGAGVLVIGHALAKRFHGRIADALTGRSLRMARKHLNDLDRFQTE